MSNHKNGNISNILNFTILLSLAASLTAVGVYAYLGSFSRYLSDDYCEAVRFQDVSLIDGVVARYLRGDWRAAGRYSNIMFVGLSEMLGDNSIPVTTVLMIVLWAIGLSWLVHELRKLAGTKWSSLIDPFLGSVIAFMSFLLAPNLFQTIYWRSSMMTHFAPLVFSSLLFAFLLQQARRVLSKPLSPILCGFVFIAAFVLAGFSEPPTATLVTVLFLLMLAIWLWNKTYARNKLLALFGWTFAGAFIGLLVMLFSPAVTNVAREKSPDLLGVLTNSFSYALMFMRDSFLSLPLPLLVSFLIPFLLVWTLKQTDEAISATEIRRLPVWMIALPFLVWLLIAAGFSPSVFGQGFPVERMRFLAQTFLIVMLMLEGLWLGLYLPEFKINRTIGAWVALILFAVISVAYPLRTAFNLVSTTLPEYRERARFWDLRNEYIHRHIAQGETEIFIPGFGGIYGIKELDSDPKHWINACAANYYHVSTIQSFSTKNIMEALSE